MQESDIIEHFIRGSGSGGQKINKTNSCVELIHKPTGIVIRCQEYRTLQKNRAEARRMLSEKLDALQKKKKDQLAVAKFKKRKQKAIRPKSVKEKILAHKKHRSSIKSARKKSWSDD